MTIGRTLVAVIRVSILSAVTAISLAAFINFAAATLSPRAVVTAAMDDGYIESRTPYDLAPWWLRTRAQADCQSIHRVFQQERSALEAAFIPRLLRDREGNGTPCELLAGYLSQPNNSRIGMRSVNEGMSASGSLIVLLAALIGWRETAILHLAILLTVITTPLIVVQLSKGSWINLLRLPVCFALSAILFAIPGSISLLPITLILLVLASLPFFAAQTESRWSVSMLLPSSCAALLCVLDPRAASVAAGLAVLLAALFVDENQQSSIETRTSLVAYALTALITCCLYAALAMITAKPGTISLPKVANDLLLDKLLVGLPQAFVKAFNEYYQWIGDGPLYSRDLAFAFLWSLPFAILMSPQLRTASQWTWQHRLRQYLLISVPILPLLFWFSAYPEMIRRNPDNYVLLAVVASMVAFSCAWSRFVPQNASDIKGASIHASVQTTATEPA